MLKTLVGFIIVGVCALVGYAIAGIYGGALGIVVGAIAAAYVGMQK